ncbi:hypothetical protein [Acinetobacter sp. Marseille-Q1618]|uniref:hypothetical protein n=1 Tax=Acinetobacter sp. Marseille-Q1618 TaxID=2697502 RepID=UPI00156F6552|nr:hypothetical protein [Acinetobacter sp. Marseille-Q1618]
MCNVILISTKQWIDLSEFNCEDISFTQCLPDYVPEIHEMKFENRWYIAGYPNEQSCSCHFRIRPLELGFNLPEEWFNEDEQSIKATLKAYEIFTQLMKLSINFEIIVSWTQGSVNTDINTIHDIDLDFKKINQDEFCFIENSRMLFSTSNK